MRPRMAAAAVARMPRSRRLGTAKRRSLAHSHTMIGSSPASTWPAKRCSSAGISAPTSKPMAATASMWVPSGCSSRMAQCSTRSVSVSTRTVSSSSSARSVARSARPARRAIAASRWARSRSEAARRASASARSLSETMRSRSERPSSRVSWWTIEETTMIVAAGSSQPPSWLVTKRPSASATREPIEREHRERGLKRRLAQPEVDGVRRDPEEEEGEARRRRAREHAARRGQQRAEGDRSP